jgi:hypothetical protein
MAMRPYKSGSKPCPTHGRRVPHSTRLFNNMDDILFEEVRALLNPLTNDQIQQLKGFDTCVVDDSVRDGVNQWKR